MWSIDKQNQELRCSIRYRFLHCRRKTSSVRWIETAPTCWSTLEKHFDPKINQKPSWNTSKVRQHTFHRSSWMMNWSAVSTVAVLHDDSTSCFWSQPRDNDFVISVVKLCSALVSAFCYSSRCFCFWFVWRRRIIHTETEKCEAE